MTYVVQVFTGQICAALTAAMLLTSCQKDETVTGYGAADKIWVLQSLDGQAFAARAELTFPAPGEIAGRAPCNRFHSTQTAPYPWFKPGPIVATEMACPALSAETAFLAALGDMTLVEVAGDTLILSNDAGRQMVFKSGT